MTNGPNCVACGRPGEADDPIGSAARGEPPWTHQSCAEAPESWRDLAWFDLLIGIDLGASCSQLFVARNRLHPKDPIRKRADAELNAIGCFHAGATRYR